MHNHRPYPHLSIPPGARPPVNPSPVEAYAPYAFELNSSPNTNLYDATPTSSRPPPVPPKNWQTPVPRGPPLLIRRNVRSAYETAPPPGGFLAFPEPEIHRSNSARSSLHPSHASSASFSVASTSPAASPRSLSPATHYPRHRSSRSDVGHSAHARDVATGESTPASAGSAASSFEEATMPGLSRELSNLTLQSDEGLRRFQKGELSDEDSEWYRLVPQEARDSLGKREVERQSVLFEVFKSERDYVADLELVRQVFIEPLRSANPPVIAGDRLHAFIKELFYNLGDILAHHKRMLGLLFTRQEEQHPIIQSVTDIILEGSFSFRSDYEAYIKHYPLAEELHRTELKRNRAYQAFISARASDPRVRKRDLATFLSRPVTRLPRLNLILQHVEKITEPGHPDKDELPILLELLSDFLKSTQPGIAAAENKVKFYNLCESLSFAVGELIDIDWYDESRTLVHCGNLARHSKSEIDWHGWNDLFVALLDNYLLLTREEKKPGGVTKRYVSSRPIPLEYLRLGSFDAPPEGRKERAEDGGLLDSLRMQTRPVYPFTVYHAAAKAQRRYTLYAPSDGARLKWRDALVDAKGVHDARRDANKIFAPEVLDDGFFRSSGSRASQLSGKKSGRVINAVSFTAMGGRRFMAVGSASGIYVGLRGDSRFQRVLSYPNPNTIIALQESNRFVIHHDSYLISYSLDLLARVSQSQSPPSSLDASLEKIAGHDGNVLFCRAGRIGGRVLLVYAVKTFLQVTVHALEAISSSDLSLRPVRSSNSVFGSRNMTSSFRPYGEPLYVPKDAYSVTTLTKTIAIATEKGIVIADPTHASNSVVAVVPDFSDSATNKRVADLKSRCEAAKPLGLIRCDASELLVVYDTIGTFITKHGHPSRSCGYIRWETPAQSFAHRGAHVLLFSSEFVEVRTLAAGKLVQVFEGTDVRLLLHSSLRPANGGVEEPLLVAMRGEKDDRDGVSDKIVELNETAMLETPSTASASTFSTEGIWDEWDM
ncbi:hypothetical protein CONPUDRAFT_163433 [Coniophora puteana RWD-64-598 SS2]|uniref:Dbl homology domain-containing protein n=1 Tax=Coniophora puteana (strain RWD-64-598) TaxID=741705 RepID=A0A5M3N040_CONPW|nr:uncharacterized protein CONPUDRAFT_163433 [Coniophora puteana RWD-64-598 SS2]EIW84261.1 hypothetical protein CONPUDRAFT_163433 [Coniophora puteana RWD-64-598 SS2]